MATDLLIKEEERIEASPAVVKPRPAFSAAVSLNRFSVCLLETSAPQRKLRKGSVLFSAALQCLIVSILLLIPLIYTDVLPSGQLVTHFDDRAAASAAPRTGYGQACQHYQ